MEIKEEKYYYSGDRCIYVLKIVRDMVFCISHSFNHGTFCASAIPMKDIIEFEYQECYFEDWLEYVTIENISSYY